MPADSEFQDIEVGSFGGGLNLALHPAYIQNHEWSWCENVYAKDNGCEAARPIESKLTSLPGFNGRITGLLINPYSSRILFIVGEESNELYLFRLDGTLENPTITEITAATSRADADQFNKAQLGFLDDKCVISCGYYQGPTVTTVVSCTGALPTTYTLVQPATGALAASFLTSFGGHIVAGGVNRDNGSAAQEERRVAWSDANNPTVWLPAVSNSADDVILDDSEGRMTGMMVLGPRLLLLFTRTAIYTLSPTSRIPAFRRDLLVYGLGAFVQEEGGTGILGRIPGGLAFVGPGSINLMSSSGGISNIGTKIAGYIRQLLNAATTFANPGFIQWHPEHQQVIVSLWNSGSGAQTALTYNPSQNAWSRLSWETLKKPGESEDLFWMNNSVIVPTAYNTNLGDWWLNQIDTRKFWRECAASVSPTANVSYVDTKDFHLGHDILELNSILLDWEPLTNATTDAIEILAHGRDQFSVARLGKEGGGMDDLSFTSIGTLTGGSSELGFQRSFRYHRLRFRNSSGRFRIRGFKLKGRRGSDR